MGVEEIKDVKEETFQHGAEESRYVDTLKIGIEKDKIEITFAEFIGEDRKEVSVASRINVHPEMIPVLLESLLIAGVTYQEDYSKDIGINIDITDDPMEGGIDNE